MVWETVWSWSKREAKNSHDHKHRLLGESELWSAFHLRQVRSTFFGREQKGKGRVPYVEVRGCLLMFAEDLIHRYFFKRIFVRGVCWTDLFIQTFEELAYFVFISKQDLEDLDFLLHDSPIETVPVFVMQNVEEPERHVSMFCTRCLLGVADVNQRWNFCFALLCSCMLFCFQGFVAETCPPEWSEVSMSMRACVYN